MAILALHHVSIIISDIDNSLRFYCDILGFEQDNSRPDLSFEGAWLKAGERQGVHLLNLPNPDPVKGRPIHGGRDRHLAFSVNDLGAIKRALNASATKFTESQSGRPALFCRDPDGNTIELIQSSS